jgi:carbamoyl-phosphate synthase small subunit
VQYHPEASPGPKDSHYLFEEFIEAIRKAVPASKSEDATARAG